MPSLVITTISPGSMSRTKSRADDVQRAGFRGQDRRAVQHRPAPAGARRRDRARRSASWRSAPPANRRLPPGAARRSACRRSGRKGCAPPDGRWSRCRRWTGRSRPRATSSVRSVWALVRLPLWAMAMPPPARSAKIGWMLRGVGAAGGGIAHMADGDMRPSDSWRRRMLRPKTSPTRPGWRSAMNWPLS